VNLGCRSPSTIPGLFLCRLRLAATGWCAPTSSGSRRGLNVDWLRHDGQEEWAALGGGRENALSLEAALWTMLRVVARSIFASLTVPSSSADCCSSG